VYYTGYVVQQPENTHLTLADQIALGKDMPMILVSVGGGRFGHELLDCVVEAAAILERKLPHHIHMFTGPFMPEEKFWNLKQAASNCHHLHIHRYTPNLLAYMQKADLSISMAGYNTTMNILTTGVRAMMLPFTGNDDKEQTMRVERLAKLGRVYQIQHQDLVRDRFAAAVIEQLQHQPTPLSIDCHGVTQTAQRIKTLTQNQPATASVQEAA
ncbi:MAG: glycosyltransferase, partial [Cyanobacteria bacterium J06639_14]